MTDLAIKAHASEIDAFREWGRYKIHSESDLAERRSYVRDELARLEAQGISPLFAAVMLPLADQQTDAFAVLVGDGRSFALRLVEGAQPPDCDAQGRRLPDGKRGKVLAAKVRQKPFGSAGERYQHAARDRDIVVHREITAKHSLVIAEDAITIMRQWGYGVRPKRAARPNGPPRRDEWLVVHVREDGSPLGPTETQDTEAQQPLRTNRSR